ncbi:sigma 54-interacting transcriptional regulator [Clostridium oceanicum]|uniref:Sigma 54-interacting transcriptional regulator n=1 Tax=Clostridium oceanicum TaxID=1543 RepID=A0ABN1J831_9CLOT
MKKLFDLVDNEDKKNPLTDNQIAKFLNLSRSEVVKLRHANNIGNSRERREEILKKEIKKIKEKEPFVSLRALTSKLNEEGFHISRNIVSRLLKTIKIKNDTIVDDTKKVEKDFLYSSFDTLIGIRGSLKSKIKLAQAAILYPTNGLHTLIYGPAGVGKSELAECMYKFAIELKTKEEVAPFIVFNCADYADNPQLLLAQLFGYKKGAFTGAEVDKKGIVEKADNGILFLDEIHRLPSEGQEMLFYLIDKGKYRRLGESGEFRDAKIMIISATTEDIGESLLTTFKRRIPMFIELPSLSKRPLGERFEIIKSFFLQESSRINMRIILEYNVVVALLLYVAKGNIGQLRSDIQVICARGFLNCIINKENYIKIEITDLSTQIVKGLLRINNNRSKIEKLINENIEILPLQQKKIKLIKQNEYILPKEIYTEIETKYEKLENEGMNKDIINRILGDELEIRVNQLIKQVKVNKRKLKRSDLKNIVGEKIVNAVENMMKKANDKLGELDDSLFYCLATHLAESYERILKDKPIQNPQLNRIKNDYKYKNEYDIAKKMAKIAESYLSIDLPEEEVGFIAMYLKSYSQKNILNDTHVGVLVLTHGHVAKGIVDVANRLLGVEHARAIEMSLDDSPKIVLEKAMEIVKILDQGKGVLMLVDMGSLVSFGNIITDKTGIQTETVVRVDTIMVIEAVRKALLTDADLREIALSIKSEKENLPFQLKHNNKIYFSKCILSLCLTGKGTAQFISNLIQKHIPQAINDIEIISLAILNKKNILDIIDNLNENKNILAIVGTVNPLSHEIPFIAAKEIIKGGGIDRLKKIIDMNIKNNIILKKYNERVSLENLIQTDLIISNSKLVEKNEILDEMASLLHLKGYVTENFIVSVHQRELMGVTVYQNSVALPHGSPEDVKKSKICILVTEKPVEWGENNKIQVVFMIALNYYSKAEFKKIYYKINNTKMIDFIKKERNPEQIREVIINGG